MPDCTWLDPLVRHFHLGDPEPPAAIQGGPIHQQTWKLNTRRDPCIVGRLHPHFDPAVTEDDQAAGQWLRRQGFPVSQFRRACDGSLP
ncbi:hypothetical protein [Synechococcus sp. H60.4]|uniref:hypothetical protein n=1 Tax=unclassified Synechococcus TaxID=2626047 RepID=UPI0039C0A757